MDHRNGGEPTAPPRPPKLLPILNRIGAAANQQRIMTDPISPNKNSITIPTLAATTTTTTTTDLNSPTSSAITALTSTSTTTASTTPPPTPPHKTKIPPIPPTPPPHKHISLATTTTKPAAVVTTTTTTTQTAANNCSHRHHDNTSGISFINPRIEDIDYDRFQILHLTYLPELPQQHNRNHHNTNITATNSFTRRRALPVPPIPVQLAGAAAATQQQQQSTSSTIPAATTILSSNHHNNNNNLMGSIGGGNVGSIGGGGGGSFITTTTTAAATTSTPPITTVPLTTIGSSIGAMSNFLSHFHSFDAHSAPQQQQQQQQLLLEQLQLQQQQQQQQQISPVTLTHPRPESERINNEYVETPLRALQQQQQQQLEHPTPTIIRAQLHASTAPSTPTIDGFYNDDAQTSTHSMLMLPQRNILQQQHNRHFNIRVGGERDGVDGIATTTLTTTTTTPLTNNNAEDVALLHSHNFKSNNLQQQQQSQLSSNIITKQPRATTLHAVNDIMLMNNNNNNGITTATNTNTTCATLNKCSVSNQQQQQQQQDVRKDRQALEDLLTPATQQNAAAGGNTNRRLGLILGGNNDALNSLTCPHCNKCRCKKCMSPRPLPQSWICNQKCYCSADTILDRCTCLCCVKAIFYHCGSESDVDIDNAPCVDDPCSCSPYKRTQRWGWLCALSLLMPCLWCYWPLRCCTKLCERVYGHFGKRGCRCRQSLASQILPNVRLGLRGNNSMLNGAAPLATVGGGLNGLVGNNSQDMDVGSLSANSCMGKNVDTTVNVVVGGSTKQTTCLHSRTLCKDHVELTSEKHLLDTSFDY